MIKETIKEKESLNLKYLLKFEIGVTTVGIGISLFSTGNLRFQSPLPCVLED
jgi:hypothetical protein